MKAAISFDTAEGQGPLMHSRNHFMTLRRLAASVLLGSCLVATAGADTDPRKKSRQEVEFGIEVARRGLWKEAIYRWQKAVEFDPDSASARNNLAVAYEQDGEFDLAEQEYKRALDLDSDNVYIRQNYELFREAYEKRKRKEEKSNP